MKKFLITYLVKGDFHHVKVEAESRESILDELAALNWYYIHEGNETVMLNKDHVSKIYIEGEKG